MGRFLHLIFSWFHCKRHRVIFSLVWIIGLISGTVICLMDEPIIFPDCFPAFFGDLNFCGLFSALIFPFFLTALIILFSQQWLLVPVIYLKAFFFSFAAISLAKSLGSSAGIITVLCLFSDFLTLPFLWFLWQRSTFGTNSSSFRAGLVSAIAVFAVCFFDVHYLVPYVVQLF